MKDQNSPVPSEATRLAQYQHRFRQHEQKATEYDRLVRRLKLWSPIAVGIAAALLFAATQTASLRIVCISFAVVAGLCWCGLQIWNGSVTRNLRRVRLFADINSQGAARISRLWDVISDIEVSDEAATQQIAADLDLFGHVSVLKLICTARTPGGVAALTSWLIEQHPDSEIVDRRRIAHELSQSLDWRQQHEALCRVLHRQRRDISRLREWALDEGIWGQPFLARVYSRVILVLMPLAALAFLLAPSGTTFSVILLLLFGNIILTVLFSGEFHSSLKQLTGRPDVPGLNALCDLFSHMVNAPLSAPIPAQARAKDAEQSLHSLRRILSLAVLLQSPIMTFFFYLPIQLFFLVDHHIVRAMLQWRIRSGRHAEEWFRSVAWFEAANSLASVEFEHPDWCVPVFVPHTSSEVRVSAIALGHPLLPAAECVRNDVEVGPPHTLFLLTGSNMSGKSTLLRAIGINILLANAGATCCCGSLQLPHLRVMTSIRITDSLSDGVSLFLAEVFRLREIVSAINLDSNPRPVLFLIDEILNGTNSRERAIAVDRFIDYLLSTSAIGIITTHDLDLADKSQNRDRLQLFHLRDTITDADDRPTMAFDYILRPGLTPVTNALKIIKLFGLAQGERTAADSSS